MIELTPNGRDGARIPPWRHYGGFLAGGVLAFLTDITVLHLLVDDVGISPFVARVFSIAVAMVVSWLMHRTFTFEAARPPSLKEFGNFAAVAWSAQAVNYLVYSGVLITFAHWAVGMSPVPISDKTFAALCGSAVAMVFSYSGFRFGVFTRGRGAAAGGDATS